MNLLPIQAHKQLYQLFSLFKTTYKEFAVNCEAIKFKYPWAAKAHSDVVDQIEISTKEHASNIFHTN